jgi:hypothetical protein
MRRFVPLTALLLATACGGPRDESRTSREDLKTYDVSKNMSASATMEAANAPPPPAIGPSAAPGVAFNYRYAFRLPGERIAAVQEQHAAACEKLGLDRCRITGMRYRLVSDDDVEAMLAFKLDPAIARQFGKTGIEAVTRADGMLVDSEISGEDAGADIAYANRNEAQLNEDLARIEAQLAGKGLGSAVGLLAASESRGRRRPSDRVMPAKGSHRSSTSMGSRRLASQDERSADLSRDPSLRWGDDGA